MKLLPSRLESFWMGVIAGVIGTLALIPTSARADDWLTVTVGSRHHKRGYNEHNWGLGMEHGLTDRWRLVAGTYRNSYWRQTVYAGAAYEFASYGKWHFGTTTMIVTGYGPRAEPVIFPAIAYEDKHWGVNFGPVLPAVIAVQLKFRF